MTLFISLRSAPVGGSVADPQLVEARWDAPKLLRPLAWQAVPERIAGRTVVFSAHGFNVSQADGIHSLGLADEYLQLDASRHVFVGVLWPGDFRIPVVNYPFESHDANDCGKRLASCIGQHFTQAAGLALFSHSLGTRVVLAAARALALSRQRVDLLCMTAGAVDRDCLGDEFDGVAANTGRIRVLASKQDRVLQLAYPAGDFVADLLDDDAGFLRAALGRKGPSRDTQAQVRAPWQIGKQSKPTGYGHGDYLPGKGATPGAIGARPARVLDLLRSELQGAPSAWPG